MAQDQTEHAEAAAVIRHLLAGGWVARDDHPNLIQSLTSQQQQFDQRMSHQRRLATPHGIRMPRQGPTGQQLL